MAFLKLNNDEILNLLPILELRFPNNAAQIYNCVQFYLKYCISGEVQDTFSFYWYCGNGVHVNETCIASRVNRKTSPDKSYWIILGPNCESDVALAQVVESFGKIVDWNKINCFNGVEERIFQAFKKVCEKNDTDKIRVFSWTPELVYWMKIEDSLKLNDDLEEHLNGNISVRKLTKEDIAEKVIKHWEFGSAEKQDILNSYIKYLNSAGVELDEELVSWGAVMLDMAIHAVHTLEEHRGKGYGKILMKNLVRSIAKSGFIPVVQVDPHNSKSIALMTNIGFQFSHQMFWTWTHGTNDIIGSSFL